MTRYGERLARLVGQRGALCAGVDPHPSLLSQWGLPVDAAGLERCARTMVEALGDLVPVFKPQSAFYELHGARGIAVLERVLADIRDAGALSLLDVKRGDIGSTMDAYAAAYLADGAPLAADAITVSPYLGFGSLTGTIELAEQNERGVYVLALTSNPEGRQVQHARAESGRSVAEEIVAAAAAANAGRAHGDVGLVVGATIGRTGVDLSAVHGSLLAPGIGAQGGTAAGLAAVFGDALPYVLPSASRELMNPGPDPARIRTNAEGMLAQMRAALPVG
ncbi:MAG TPA: orotidine-5'-phosphate decarboxylase [Microlunatus sp.]|nr:orotidine-5'-phosphate decarboxylase [Microlunatus sp.]